LGAVCSADKVRAARRDGDRAVAAGVLRLVAAAPRRCLQRPVPHARAAVPVHLAVRCGLAGGRVATAQRGARRSFGRRSPGGAGCPELEAAAALLSGVGIDLDTLRAARQEGALMPMPAGEATPT